MARRRQSKDEALIELFLKGGVGLIILVALATGGFQGFAERFKVLFVGFLQLAFLSAIALGAIVGIIYIIRKTDWSHISKSVPQWAPSDYIPGNEIPFVWTDDIIKEKLTNIDWYQFEKFCSAILDAEGFTVSRKGGATADGGVDIIAQKNQTKTLIQCKHWKTWKVREPTIRELLGSMFDFGVNKGAIFFSGEATQPALKFAEKHGIGMVDGIKLSERACKGLSDEQLHVILNGESHHCPKCESKMIWRTGDFKSQSSHSGLRREAILSVCGSRMV
jgi:Holliday junction resolvase